MSASESKSPITQADLVVILNRQTEAGNALVVAGLVEDWLEKLLLAAGRELSKESVKRIFGGPLKYFKPKIEIAYMFQLIDEPVRDDLRVIADIRNAFAHTTRFVYFGSEHIAKYCCHLSGWRDGADNQECYRNTALDCINLIKRKMDTLMYARALLSEPTVDLDEDED